MARETNDNGVVRFPVRLHRRVAVVLTEDAPLAAIRRACDIEVKAIKWGWYRKFALGKLNLLVGEPGCNKIRCRCWTRS